MYQVFKRIFLLFISVFGILLVLAQSQDPQFTLLQSSSEGAIVRIDFPTYSTHRVDVNGKTMYHLDMKSAYPILETGSPSLLEAAFSLIIPENSHPTATIIASEYTSIPQFELAPSKGKLYRNVNPDDVAYIKGSSFFENRFLRDNEVTVGESYQLRDYTGVAIQVYPFSYNPIQKILRAYSSITVEVQYNSQQSFRSISSVAKAYNDIYAGHFLNYSTAKSAPLEEMGDILILAPDEFCEAMQPYADWKIQNGYRTEIVPLSIAGHTGALVKSYIANYYNEHNLAYVVIVGDNNKFPTLSVDGNVSDNYYAEIVGNDKYPDFIIGKISAETAEQVTLQVNKFLQYEQSPVETAHFPVFCGIASSQGPGDNNEYDYAHIRNIGNTLNAYTYTSGYELFEGNHGGLDASGNPTAAQVLNIVNNGVGIINYCGHGNVNIWSTSNFNNSNINNLTNYNKLPFIISVACLNGNYVNNTCFAEAWLRANKNGQPTGAVGTLMSLISQPWNSPMCAQDEMIRLLTGTSSVTQKHTFGGIVFNGFIKMLDNYNDYEVSRTWILFGDPAMMVRTAIPEQLSVEHFQEIPYGFANIDFASPVENARIILTHNGEIVEQGTISNGQCLLTIPTTLQESDTLNITAVAPNHLPYQGRCILIPNEGPFVTYKSMVIHDNRNNDGLANYGETITMDVVLKNIGSEDATNVSAQLTTSDSYLTILDGSQDFGSIDAGAERTFSAAYQLKVSNDVPANYTASLLLHISFDNQNFTTHIPLQTYAPSLVASNITVDDATLGNNNKSLDLGETAMLKFTVSNEGNYDALGGTAVISCPGGELQLYRYPQELPALSIGSSQTLLFKAKAKVNEPTTARVHVLFVTSDNRIESADLFFKIGSVIENWESGDFNSLNWNNNSVSPWKITTSNPYEGTYAVRSGNIGNSANSTLSISHTNSADDTLSFYYKVSSEENYDFLKFYMDNTVVESWSGNIGWTKYSTLVPAGTHTFQWQYSKDNYMSSGSDMAMLDYISFPCLNRTTGVEDAHIPEIAVLPNPTSDVIQIMIPEDYDLNNATLQLFDLSGRLLQQEEVVSSVNTLSLASYAQGMYILKLVNNHTILKSIKIIKQQ